MLHTIQPKPSQYCGTHLPRMVPIAPAPEKNYMDTQTEIRRYTSKSNPYTGAQAASIARRNARERNRVKQVNDGFNALRKRLPAAVIAALSGGSRRGSGKKLSKVDTLKMVVEYIKYLQNIIEESDAALGITHENKQIASYEVDEGVFGGQSPYSESVPSPAGSECSSGVSSAYSNSGYYPNYQVSEQKLSPMEEYELLDAISWWQEK
ncbi:achaete-scute complex protein T3-like [Pectinophora gossypiella]|uniref:achaete-scute complex protein T3-like n=1 Tax=Pectinophora gossypiella TaxID=13191 RepID=UPI00214F4630|nr:achaete-scute complex protein T3-like [Pectinophora gossypiella]